MADCALDSISSGQSAKSHTYMYNLIIIKTEGTRGNRKPKESGTDLALIKRRQ